MKANSILKIAIVAMAALGAYAFSGNNVQQTPFTEVYYLDSEIGCTNIEARCALVGDADCMILVNNTPTNVFDLSCNQKIKHNSLEPVDWR